MEADGKISYPQVPGVPGWYFGVRQIRIRTVKPQTKDAELACRKSYNETLYWTLKAQGKFAITDEEIAKVKAFLDKKSPLSRGEGNPSFSAAPFTVLNGLAASSFHQRRWSIRKCQRNCGEIKTVALQRKIPALLGNHCRGASSKLNKRTCESGNRAHYWIVFGDRGVEQPGSSSGS